MKLPTCITITANFLIVVHNENFSNAKSNFIFCLRKCTIHIAAHDVTFRTYLSLKTDVKILRY